MGFEQPSFDQPEADEKQDLELSVAKVLQSPNAAKLLELVNARDAEIIEKYDTQRQKMVDAGVMASLMTGDEKQTYYDATSRKKNFLDTLRDQYGIERDKAEEVYNELIVRQKTQEPVPPREKNKSVETSESFSLSHLGNAEKLLLTTESGNRYMIFSLRGQFLISSERDKQRGTVLTPKDMNAAIKTGEAFSYGNGAQTSRIVKFEKIEALNVQKDLIRRRDINETGGWKKGEKDFAESIQALLEENQFNAGDKIVFFAERERQGILEKDVGGSLYIRDTSGNRWGLVAVLSSTDGYLRKL